LSVENAAHLFASDVILGVPGLGINKPLLPERGESRFTISQTFRTVTRQSYIGYVGWDLWPFEWNSILTTFRLNFPSVLPFPYLHLSLDPR
jgi:hypothetical protein